MFGTDEPEIEQEVEAEVEGSEEFEADGEDQSVIEEDDSEDGDDFDLPDVPEELADFKKQLIKGMNKKFQTHAEKLKESQKKAEAFDKILNDPQARKTFLAALGSMDAGDGNGAGNAQRSGPSFNIRPDVKPEEVFDEATMHGVEAAIGGYLDKVLAPALKPYQDAIVALFSERGNSEWEALDKEYSGASGHRQAVEQLLARNPGMTKKQALFAVAGETLLQAKAPAKTGKTKPKGISLTKPGSVQASRIPSSAKGEDPYDFMRRAAKEAGFSF